MAGNLLPNSPHLEIMESADQEWRDMIDAVAYEACALANAARRLTANANNAVNLNATAELIAAALEEQGVIVIV